MVAMNHLDIFELVAAVVDLRVGLWIHVGHITPVVCVQGTLAGVEDEAINACAIDCRG